VNFDGLMKNTQAGAVVPAFKLGVDGGVGDDLIVVTVHDNSTTGKATTVAVAVQTSNGDDDITADLKGRRSSGTVDGGPGFDSCAATGNFTLTRCEQVT